MLAISSGVPVRRKRHARLSASISSLATFHASSTRGLAIAPAATQLARMPYLPHSAAVTLVNICSADLAAE